MINLIIITFVLCLPLYLFGEKADDLIQAIDKKIAELREEMHKEQLVEMQEEVEGQGLMIADWPAYGQEVMRIRKNEIKNSRFQKKIDELEQHKQALLKERQTNSPAS